MQATFLLTTFTLTVFTFSHCLSLHVYMAVAWNNSHCCARHFLAHNMPWADRLRVFELVHMHTSAIDPALLSCFWLMHVPNDQPNDVSHCKHIDDTANAAGFGDAEAV